jgi:serine protease Do
MLRVIIILLLFIPLLPAPAYAQSLQYIKITAGTGFAINSGGDIITNAHVVQACQSITIGTDHGDVPAALLASDAAQDLAVLHVPPGSTAAVAPLRWNISDLAVGDAVVVMGYPGQASLTGRYQFRKSSITSLHGPTGEAKWLQLASVAEKGNSGGPVLDTGGNVIAVISGLAMTYKVGQDGKTTPQLIGQSDIAITLTALQDFLRRNQIGYYESASGLVAYGDGALETNAHRFIVSVRCNQGVIAP